MPHPAHVRRASRPWIAPAALLAAVVAEPAARADQFHSANFLLGSRAQRMGGAYVALSDDASGVTYNPGGTAFARGADASLSAATFYQRKTSYERVYGNDDFRENARGALSTSLAGLTRLGGTAPLTGATFGFALSTPDAGLVDENTRVGSALDANLISYHRTQSSRSTTLHAAGSLAFGLGKTLGVGLGGGYFDVDELTLIFQNVLQGPYSFREVGSTPVRSLSMINSRASVRVGGLEASAGLRWQPWEPFGLGLSIRARQVIRQRTTVERDRVEAWIGPDGAPVKVEGTRDTRFAGRVVRTQTTSSSSDAYRAWPTELRAGFALRPFGSLIWTFDAVHTTGAPATPAPLTRAAVTNLHTGAEIIWFSRLATRAGGFTNFDATPTRDPLSAEGRGEHVDFLGASGGLAMRFKKSEYGANYIHQWGRGKAEKAPGRASDVISRLQMLTFTAAQAL